MSAAIKKHDGQIKSLGYRNYVRRSLVNSAEPSGHHKSEPYLWPWQSSKSSSSWTFFYRRGVKPFDMHVRDNPFGYFLPKPNTCLNESLVLEDTANHHQHESIASWFCFGLRGLSCDSALIPESVTWFSLRQRRRSCESHCSSSVLFPKRLFLWFRSNPRQLSCDSVLGRATVTWFLPWS